MTHHAEHCFKLNTGNRWRTGPQTDWLDDEYTTDGTEKYRGFRILFGVYCRVFVCADGKYRAQAVDQYDDRTETNFFS